MPIPKRIRSKVPDCHHGPTNSFTVSSPIGEIIITSCPRGVHGICQSNDLTDDNFQPDYSMRVEKLQQQWDDNGYTYKPAITCINWLKVYFENVNNIKNTEEPSICFTSYKPDSFNVKVWQTLTIDVPVSSTISYGDLAAKTGNSRAARAVGMAMKRNPFQLLVPCHRVIQSGGCVGNYCSGQRNKVKLWLLMHEGATL